MKKKIQLSLFIIILPFFLSFFSYFGYVSTYSVGIISEGKFLEEYGSGIYKYRILSKYLILGTNQILKKVNSYTPGPYLHRILNYLDDKGTLSFYLSYFFINTIFLILSSTILYFLGDVFFKNKKQVFLFILFFVMGIIITQYVVVPYDYSSYFFILLILYLFIRYEKKGTIFNYIILLTFIFISVLNRETSALAVIFIITVFYYKYGMHKSVLKSIPFALSFVIPYITLRLIFGFDNGIIQGFGFRRNFELFNLIGIAFYIITTLSIFQFSKNESTKKILLIYLFLSVPYFIILLISGVTFEVRLWTPVLINLIIMLLYFDNIVLLSKSN